jgi:hypothetical protein
MHGDARNRATCHVIVRQVDWPHADGTPLAMCRAHEEGAVNSALLQHWLSVGGSSAITSLTQGADLWLDLGDYEDVGFTLEVKAVTGTVTMNYETSPSIEDASFLACVVPFTITTGVRSDTLLASCALVPTGQYVRWRLSTGGGAWNVTFRIWLSLYSLAA